MKRILLSAFFAVGLAFPRGAGANSERVRDEFFERIATESRFGAYEIEIYVNGGYVKLDGSVASEASRKRAEALAYGIPGVTKVENNLVLTNGFSPQSASGAQVRRIMAAVRAGMLNTAYELKVSTDDQGYVLHGRAPTQADVARINEIVRREAPGYLVRSMIVAGSQFFSDQDIKARLLQALRANPEIDVSEVHLEVKDGVVSFGGTFRNHLEIDRILTVAVMVEGVRDVQSTAIVR